mgnify:CR=1 FL=1
MSDEVLNNNKKGYKTKLKSLGRSKFKYPIYCPNENCRMITSNLDNQSLDDFGVCLSCYVNFIENRQKPIIDIEFYRKRLQERGY